MVPVLLVAAAAAGTVFVPPLFRAAPSLADAPRPVPGIVLLCVDTLRADAVGTAARTRGLMPSLEAFGTMGATFTDAVAPSSWTAPSVTSVLTGLLPSHHGLRTPGDQVPDAVRTLAEVLRDAGWHTAAHTAGGWVRPVQGALQGFETVDLGFDEAPPEAAVGRWNATRPADAPFFLFLHTFAAHDPYGDKSFQWGADRTHPQAAVDFAGRLNAHAAQGSGPLPSDLEEAFLRTHLADPLGRRALGDLLLADLQNTFWRASPPWMLEGWRRGPDGGRALAADLRAAYESGLRFADQVVARTMGALAACRLPPETVVVVFGDHGEGLGEAGTLYHGLTLEESLIRVPLVIRAPGRVAPGSVLGGTCSLLDLAPTLAGWAGVPPPEGLDGVPLDEVLAGGAGRPVVSEVDRSTRGIPGPPTLVSVRVAGAKWVLGVDAARGVPFHESVYDLRVDPLEQDARQPETVPSHGGAFCDAVARERHRWVVGDDPARDPCRRTP